MYGGNGYVQWSCTSQRSILKGPCSLHHTGVAPHPTVVLPSRFNPLLYWFLRHRANAIVRPPAALKDL